MPSLRSQPFYENPDLAVTSQWCFTELVVAVPRSCDLPRYSPLIMRRREAFHRSYFVWA